MPQSAMPPDSPDVQTRRLHDLEARLNTELKKSALVRDVGRAFSSGLGLDELLTLIMEKVTLLMEADRSTLYLLSDDGRQLWSKILQGGDFFEIRLVVGEGIAGWVAESGEIVNIPDAYTDTRFQPAVDSRSGYRTQSILCAPMRNNQGDIVGVLQVLNKKGGPFTADDEELLLALASQAAMAIENAKLYHSVVAKNVELLEAQAELQQKSDELNVLYEIEKLMNADLPLDELLTQILHQAMVAVGAASGSVVLRRGDSNHLQFRTAVGPTAELMADRMLSVGEGVIGWVVAHDQPVVVNDPKNDSRHASRFAEALGLSPKNLACAPLRGNMVLGAIELVDKIEPEGKSKRGFSEHDLKLLVLIAGQVAKAIQLSRARSARSKQERLASIGRMLAGVLHDLKTPMTIISGYAQLMAQIDDSDQRETYVDQILRQFDFMSGMTREVLAFARGETEVLIRRVFLHRFFEEVATQLKHALAGRNIVLEVDARYNGTAYFDEHKVMRLLHNLTRNAADAMPGGGQVRITSNLDRAGEEEFLVIDVADNGPGIPTELEGRLFEMFATGRQGGTGLGLAIVKKIVDEHQGTISYVSRLGAGTCFTVKLPRKRIDATNDILEQTAH
jgi:signal transduction histidine kinase